MRTNVQVNVVVLTNAARMFDATPNTRQIRIAPLDSASVLINNGSPSCESGINKHADKNPTNIGTRNGACSTFFENDTTNSAKHRRSM